ncbi:MAG TPA: hypothetical protein VHZ09_20210 [Acidobacteriaceae bacterium]|nr:hypothetical protein [Acidobacteriaceae bacterium]
MQCIRPLSLAILLLATATLSAQPQRCPDQATGTTIPVSVTGTIEYHPGVYAWYGLRPPQSICGQKVVQVGFDDSAAFRQAHRFVGCQVTAAGNLFVPDTGYWSTSLGITDAHLQPDQTCKQSAPFPDYSAIPVPSILRRYKITAAYDPKTFTFSAQAHDTSTGKLLSPSQTYASDRGNGARDLQRMFCAEGFLASDPTDTLGQPDLQANIDPDFPSAIEVAIPSDSVLQVSFVCTRASSTKDK